MFLWHLSQIQNVVDIIGGNIALQSPVWIFKYKSKHFYQLFRWVVDKIV